MWLSKRPKDKSPVGGEIAYFGLTDWWLSVFTDTEREFIEARYRPLGVARTERSPLTHGHITSRGGTAAQLLWGLSTWFRQPDNRQIAHRILQKAVEVAKAGSSVLDQHFTYQEIIRTYYPDRDAIPTALDTAISACEKQIALAPKAAEAWKREYPGEPLPGHTGYTQLAVIREKQKDFTAAVSVSRLALEQGWAGDWEHRVARNEKNIHRKRSG